MIDTILLILPLLMIFSLSAALNKKFGFYIEHAIFFSMYALTLFLIFTGLIGILGISYYIIIALSILSLVYLVIKKYDFSLLVTPATVGFVFVVLVFAFITRNIELCDHDEVAHWALATKYMHYSNVFYKGMQTMFVATFNYFVTKSSSFTDSHLYVGAWMLIWSAFLLPAGGRKWKEWKYVLIYMVGVYSLTGYISKNVAFHTDEYMAYLGGALAVYWALQKKKGLKEYLLAIIGLIAISQIKDSFGAVCSMCVAIFIIANEVYLNFDDLKKTYHKIVLIFLAPVSGYFISKLTMEKPDNYYDESALSGLPIYESLKNSKAFLLVAALFLLCFIAFIFFSFNKKEIKIKQRVFKIYKLLLPLGMLIFLVAAYKAFMLLLSSFSYNELNAFVEAWEDYFYQSSGGMINTYSSSISILVFIFACGFALKKKKVKITVVRALALYSSIFIIGILVLIAFYAGFYESGQYSDSISWERYTSTPFIMMLTYLAGYFMLSSKDYKKGFNYRLVFSFVIMIFLLKYVPYPGSYMMSQYSSERNIYKAVKGAVQEDADILNEYLDYPDTVFVASYENDLNGNQYGDSRTKWLKYQIAPIESNWNYYEEYSVEEGFTGSYEDFCEMIAEFDYFYVQSAGDKFYDKFGDLFPDNIYYDSNALYKIELTNGEITLIPVYLDESKLIENN